MSMEVVQGEQLCDQTLFVPLSGITAPSRHLICQIWLKMA